MNRGKKRDNLRTGTTTRDRMEEGENRAPKATIGNDRCMPVNSRLPQNSGALIKGGIGGGEGNGAKERQGAGSEKGRWLKV